MNAIAKFSKALIKDAWQEFFGGKGEFGELTQKTALVFEGSLSREVCDTLIQEIERVLADRSHPRIWRDALGADCRILGFEKDIGGLIDHFEIKRRLLAIGEYLGTPIQSWHLMANRVVPREDNLGSGGGWHRDSPYSHEVKCIWYLNDVASENGPFQFLPDSHRKTIAMRKEYPLGDSRFEALMAEDMPVEVTGKAGSLLVCDTKCVHRGKPIEEGARYAVTIYTSPNAEDKKRRVINIED
ncbi:phytanoyl-CoA dioxygenase family protein [Parasphingorhabdus sp.]|uniref:phytanoyl-CoA dioxygenase family protein n=1 Tax=Parasphingorhabdus sp. TaxID=2709688 RepID=UPI003266B807